MERQQAGQLIDKVLDMATKTPGTQADVLLHRGQSLSLSAQNGKIDKTSVSSSQIIGLRYIHDQRVGVSYTESFDDASLVRLIANAANNARFAAPNPYEHIEVSGQEFVETDASYNQPDNASIQEKMALTLELESAVKKDSRVKSSPYNGYADGVGEMYYGNHLGTHAYHRERSFSCGTSALASEGDKQAMFYDRVRARTFHELDVQRVAQRTLAHAIPLLDAKPIPTGEYDVVFDINALRALLGCFASVFSAKAAKEGKSSWKDKLGATVADQRLTWRDVPAYAKAFSHSGFDDEGTARKDLTLIKDGVLQSFYHNTATAQFFKTKTTGHASRSPQGALGVSGTQWVIEPGQDDDASLFSGRVLKVFNLQGLHSGTNAITGHLSLGAEGFLLEDGKEVQSVKNITVAGNLFTLLQSIAAVGRTLQADTMDDFFSPMIRFKGLRIAGT